MSEHNQNGSFHHENFHNHEHAEIVNPDPYHNHPYRQIGGWLLFFMILEILPLPWMLFTSIRSYVFVLGGEFSVYAAITFGSLLLSSLAFVFDVMFICCVFRRDHLFLRYLQIRMILALTVSAITFTASIFLVAPNVAVVGASMFCIGTSMSFAIGFALLMVLYYCKSERVRIYMGGEEFKDKALFAFR